MLELLRSLPLSEHGNAEQVGLPQYRCDLLAAGHLQLSPSQDYRYNNQFRQEQACILQITLNGYGYFQAGVHAVQKLQAGDCFIVDLPSETSYFLGKEPWEFIYLYYTGELAYHHSQSIIREHGYYFQLQDRPELEAALMQIMNMVNGSQRNGRMVSGALYQCLMAAYPKLDPHSQLGGVHRARDFIDSHYHDSNLSIQAIAASADLSRYHFSRIFKQTFELSPYAYLGNKRIDKAKELLLTTKLQSAQIAERVGFNDYPYFCNVFKKHIGMTPKQYRDAIHGEK